MNYLTINDVPPVTELPYGLPDLWDQLSNGEDTFVPSRNAQIVVTDAIVTDDVAAVTIIYTSGNGAIECFDGSAKREPNDPPNDDLALTLAYSRALGKLHKRLSRQATGWIKHADDIRDDHEKRKKAAEKLRKAEARKRRKSSKK